MHTNDPSDQLTSHDVLTAELAQLDDRVSSAEEALATAKGQQKAVAAALRALTRASKPKSRRKGISRDEAASAIRRVLASNPNLAGEELKEAVQQRLRADSKPLTGLHLTYRSALREVQEEQSRDEGAGADRFSN